MTDANRHNDLLTADDLRNYRAGTLSAADQHRVERLLLENPLYADALEGLETAEQEGVALSTASNALRERLQNRIGDQKVRRWPVWIPAAAASVVLVLSIGLYMRWHEKPESVNVVGLPVPQPQISASKEDAPRVVPTEIPHSEQIAKKVAPPKSIPAAPKVVQNPRKDSLIFSKDHLIASSSELRAAPGSFRSASEEIVVYNTTGLDNPGLSGQVTDEANQPLAGVSIVAKNARRSSSSDSLGRFRLENVDKKDSLQIMSVGFETQTVRVADLESTKIQLKPDSKALSEVVAVGYGQQAQTDKPAARRVASLALANSGAPSAPANFKTYVEENRRMPPEAKAKTVTGTVRVRFQVAADGSVSQFTIVQSLGYGCDEEAVRLIREGPRWKPAFRNGKPLIQFVEQDIAF